MPKLKTLQLTFLLQLSFDFPSLFPLQCSYNLCLRPETFLHLSLHKCPEHILLSFHGVSLTYSTLSRLEKCRAHTSTLTNTSTHNTVQISRFQIPRLATRSNPNKSKTTVTRHTESQLYISRDQWSFGVQHRDWLIGSGALIPTG